MAALKPLSEISTAIAGSLVSTRHWGDASYISLPLVYPSGSFVTVSLSYAPDGIRVSDGGFAYRETESFGAGRSFANTARAVAEGYGVEVDRRAIFVEVPVDEVERAIFDVSAASKAVAERIVAGLPQETEFEISAALRERLERAFPGAVEHDCKLVGASSIEWDVTALARIDGREAVFQAVASHPVSVFKASAAFHDLARLDDPPILVGVVARTADLGKHHAILAQAGRVIEVDAPEEAFRRAAA